MKIYDVVIKDGCVIDGSGKEPFCADVAVVGDRIAAIGKVDEREATEIIHAKGCCVCPGFIDAHCHSDVYLTQAPLTEGKVMQGVTLDVCGLCGSSAAPVGEGHIDEQRARIEYALPCSDEKELTPLSFDEYGHKAENLGIAANIAMFVGNRNLRTHSLGFEDRRASFIELESMAVMLRQAMVEGAWGLSSGLTYVPSQFSSTEELIFLSRVMAPWKGCYNSHMRNEGDGVLDSIEEVCRIAAEAQCLGHISHLKVMGRRNHGKSDECLRLIHEANAKRLKITFDVYPYTAGSCALSALLPPFVLEAGLEKSTFDNLSEGVQNRVIEEFRKDNWENYLRSCGAQNILIGCAPGLEEYEGKSLAELAPSCERYEIKTIFNILAATEAKATMIYHALSEDDLRAFLRDPLCMIGTDAFSRHYKGVTASGRPHPRNYGAFPRFIRKYLLDEGLLSLQEGVRRMTSLPALFFGLQGRGRIEKDCFADITVFDPGDICEKGSYLVPNVPPQGIRYVLVNGRAAVIDGDFSGKGYGRFLKKSDTVSCNRNL